MPDKIDGQKAQSYKHRVAVSTPFVNVSIVPYCRKFDRFSLFRESVDFVRLG
jgi:hypothetical protein